MHWIGKKQTLVRLDELVRAAADDHDLDVLRSQTVSRYLSKSLEIFHAESTPEMSNKDDCSLA